MINKKLLTLLLVMLFFSFTKTVKAECLVATENQIYVKSGTTLCQYSSQRKERGCYGFSLDDVKYDTYDNYITLTSYNKCLVPKEENQKLLNIVITQDMGNFYECFDKKWQLKESKNNVVCYNYLGNKELDLYKFSSEFSNSSPQKPVENLKVKLYTPISPTLNPSQTPDPSVKVKKCVIPDAVDLFGRVKTLVPNIRLDYNEGYCKREGDKDIIYECNDGATEKIKVEGDDEYFIAKKQRECLRIYHYDLGDFVNPEECNYLNEKKLANEIKCQSSIEQKCDSGEECLSECPVEYYEQIQGKYCGKIKDGKYEKVCCRRKFNNIQMNEDAIPLLTCGNGEAKLGEKSKRCCPMTQKNTYYSLSPFFSLIERIPILGSSVISIYEEFINKTNDIQNKVTYEPCFIGYPSTPNNLNDPQCLCLSQLEITPTPFQSVREMCERYLPNLEGRFTKENENCRSCAEKAGMWTAFGCLRGNFSDFIKFNIFGTALSLAGLFAILCIIYSAIILQTSAGNPEKIKKAQELLTSCIMGLVLIIFSVFLLKLIGVDILKIPGFGK